MYNSDKSSTCPRIFCTGPVCKTFFADPELRARTRVPWVILLMEEILHHVQPWFHGMFLQGFLSTRFWLSEAPFWGGWCPNFSRHRALLATTAAGASSRILLQLQVEGKDHSLGYLKFQQLAPEKLPGPKRKVIFEPAVFRGYLKNFRGVIWCNLYMSHKVVNRDRNSGDTMTRNAAPTVGIGNMYLKRSEVDVP